jgi:hypothetical protein
MAAMWAVRSVSTSAVARAGLKAGSWVGGSADLKVGMWVDAWAGMWAGVRADQ